MRSKSSMIELERHVAGPYWPQGSASGLGLRAWPRGGAWGTSGWVATLGLQAWLARRAGGGCWPRWIVEA